jgi:hypothetical protein
MCQHTLGAGVVRPGRVGFVLPKLVLVKQISVRLPSFLGLCPDKLKPIDPTND